MFKSRYEKYFFCFLFPTELLSPRSGLYCQQRPDRWLRSQTASLGLKSIHIKESAFLIRARSMKEMSQKDEI